MPAPGARTAELRDAVGDIAKTLFGERMTTLNENHAFYNYYMKELRTKHVGGGTTLHYRPSVLEQRDTVRNVSMGSFAESEFLGDPGKRTGDQVTIPIYYHYGATQLTGPAMAALEASEDAFVSEISRQVNGLTDDFERWLDIMLMNDGNGAYCWSNSSTSTSGSTHTMRELWWNPPTSVIDINRPIQMVGMNDGAYEVNTASVAVRSVKAKTNTSLTFNTGTHTGFVDTQKKLVGFASRADTTTTVVTDLGDLDATNEYDVKRQMPGITAIAMWQGNLIGDAAAKPDRSATVYYDPNQNELTIQISGSANRLFGVNRNTDANFHADVQWAATPGYIEPLTKEKLMRMWLYIHETRGKNMADYDVWTSPKVLADYHMMGDAKRFLAGMDETIELGITGTDPKKGTNKGVAIHGRPIRTDPYWPTRTIAMLHRPSLFRCTLGPKTPEPLYAPGHSSPWHFEHDYDAQTFRLYFYSSLGCSVPQNHCSIQNLALTLEV